MTRISDPMDWSELEQLAKELTIKLVYRVARCQHGYTRNETCRDCENGYANDHHTFANVGNTAFMSGRPLVAVSDDGNDVAYVSDVWQHKIPS
jgi:hypothetical protein